jgi:N-acetylneuraminic acid mutarotase
MKLTTFARLLLGLSAIAITMITHTLHAEGWEKLGDLPAPNGGLIGGAVEGKLVIVGGTNWEKVTTKSWLREVREFDPATSQWRVLGALNQPIAYGAGGIIDGALVIVSGSTGEAPFGGVIRIVGGKIFEEPAGGFSRPGVLGANGVIGDEIIIVGGSDDAANIKAFSRDAYAWNARTHAMRKLATYPGSPLGTAASAVVGGELFIFAGVTWDVKADGIANLTESHAYSPRSDSWRKLRGYPHPTRGVAGVALDDHHIYLAGGYGEKGFTSEGFIYDSRADEYRPALPLPTATGTHLVRVGDFVYFLGGEDRPKHRSSDVYRIPVSRLLQTEIAR